MIECYSIGSNDKLNVYRVTISVFNDDRINLIQIRICNNIVSKSEGALMGVYDNNVH